MRSVLLTVSLLLVSGISDAADDAGQRLNRLRSRLFKGDPTRIVCFGDSITGVYYHSGSQRAWCDMLGLALGKAYPIARLDMINAGISGHTTVQALARIDKDVIARQPHLVVVKFGMNDVARVPLEQFKTNMQAISRRCLATGAAVVLCTPNSVFENTARPNAKLSAFSMAIRETARDLKLPLVDLFRDWQEQRKSNEIAWSLLMSDAIHPNMNGHRRIAELVASEVSDKPLQEVSLSDVPPPNDALQHTFHRLSEGRPVRVVAMPPYDREIPAALNEYFPAAKFEITTWPVGKLDVGGYAEWAKRIRGLKPHLVVVAVPTTARSRGVEEFIRSYEWVLNRSFHFSGRPWDVLPILPSTDSDASDENAEFRRIALEIVRGKDVQFFPSSLGQRLVKLVGKQKAAWEQRQ